MFIEKKIRVQNIRKQVRTLTHTVIIGNPRNFHERVISLSRGAVFLMYRYVPSFLKHFRILFSLSACLLFSLFTGYCKCLLLKGFENISLLYDICLRFKVHFHSCLNFFPHLKCLDAGISCGIPLPLCLTTMRL